MTIEWTFFLSELVQNPILLVVTLLNIGVIVVNGATDAPNAIATAVSTRAMKPRHAIIMAAISTFWAFCSYHSFPRLWLTRYFPW